MAEKKAIIKNTFQYIGKVIFSLVRLIISVSCLYQSGLSRWVKNEATAAADVGSMEDYFGPRSG